MIPPVDIRSRSTRAGRASARALGSDQLGLDLTERTFGSGSQRGRPDPGRGRGHSRHAETPQDGPAVVGRIDPQVLDAPSFRLCCSDGDEHSVHAATAPSGQGRAPHSPAKLVPGSTTSQPALTTAPAASATYTEMDDGSDAWRSARSSASHDQSSPQTCDSISAIRVKSSWLMTTRTASPVGEVDESTRSADRATRTVSVGSATNPAPANALAKAGVVVAVRLPFDGLAVPGEERVAAGHVSGDVTAGQISEAVGEDETSVVSADQQQPTVTNTAPADGHSTLDAGADLRVVRSQQLDSRRGGIGQGHNDLQARRGAGGPAQPSEHRPSTGMTNEAVGNDMASPVRVRRRTEPTSARCASIPTARLTDSPLFEPPTQADCCIRPAARSAPHHGDPPIITTRSFDVCRPTRRAGSALAL
jgi:hypothetical protein